MDRGFNCPTKYTYTVHLVTFDDYCTTQAMMYCSHVANIHEDGLNAISGTLMLLLIAHT